MVEIMKSYARDIKVIAFDEPTTALTTSEIKSLFMIIEKLKKDGKIIIYVSHRMDEIDEIADKILIFRDGKKIELFKNGKYTRNEMIKLMVGRDIESFLGDKVSYKTDQVALEVKDICSDEFKNINFKVNKGEILGISGLVGSGRTELMEIVYGIENKTSGDIYFNNKHIEIKSPHDSIFNGIGFCPEDRKNDGIFPDMSVEHNSSIAILHNFCSKLGIINTKKDHEFIYEGIKRFNIQTPSIDKKIGELSGGNQQKVLLSRWMSKDIKILILDEPTKGIDVGAKMEFYKLIREFAQEGRAIIVISSELPELIGLSDRILVMKDQQIVANLENVNLSEQEILSYSINS